MIIDSPSIPEGRGRRLVAMDRAEALHLLAGVSLGRIVFTHRALPAIRPVNHVVYHGDIIVRSHPGAAVMSAASERVIVAYEADAIDPVHQLGWSVVVTGHAHLVTDPELLEHFRHRLQPWVGEVAMTHVIRIEAELVTGFHLSRPEEPADPPRSRTPVHQRTDR